MIVEERIYTIQATKLGAFKQIIEGEAHKIQIEHLGQPVGYFFTEIGPLNQVIHLWGFKDMEDRAMRRKALQSDPRWKEPVSRLSALIVSQENKLLIPASFSPVN